MKITIAKDAGYCFGVRDAVNMAYDASDKFGEVYMLGDIVHNENVIDDLSNSGATKVKKLDDIPKNKPILFRAHGTVNDLWEEAESKNMNILDATCPLVHEIHHEVRRLYKENRQIIVIGDHGHDEVKAIANQVPNTIVIANSEEAKKIKKFKKAGVVSQSTQMIENVQEIISVLMTKIFDLSFVNTICYPTKRNHEQIKDLSNKSDLMIIIGSFKSANSKRLTELAKQRNKNTYQVTCADDLEVQWFNDIESVGISAGASTPDYLIEGVANRIKKIDKERS